VSGALEPRQTRRFPLFSLTVFAAFLIFAAAYVTRTVPTMPQIVASHFDATGDANGFMLRDQYQVFILIVSIAVPLGLVTLLTAVYSFSADLKLPHSDYWLAPEQRDRTVGLLITHGIWFGSLLAAFMCYVHRLELAANALTPPHLSSVAITSGLVVFTIATLAWAGSFMLMFRLPVSGRYHS
jgi:uncharacterized membrane protein